MNFERLADDDDRDRQREGDTQEAAQRR